MIEIGADSMIRWRLMLTGTLQGIGFRPTVYRLAVQLGLGGWVVNTDNGVIIEIEGTPRNCRRFIDDLPREIPRPGRIDTSDCRDIPSLSETAFTIRPSIRTVRTITPIPPDIAVCPECVREMFDPENPRHLYPFTTCTLCGPRFTVVRSFPYDRERTSMADFTMCPRCRREYEDPADRRFHSQTNSCPDCGPTLQLLSPHGCPLNGEPLSQAISMLMAGKILAVKGIGGFHLACDALNEEGVGKLRERKGRAEKPFAVMARDMETAAKYCRINEKEAQLLTSAVAPIVLLDAAGSGPAHNVAPGMKTLGMMLPYAPLHHLLFKSPGAAILPKLLVMTSGNRSDEPICRDNDEAIARLGDLCDALLVNNREIVLRADDSIFRVMADMEVVFRRSRGLVPGEFRPNDSREPGPCVIAAGGDLKNLVTIIKDGHIVPGPHVGDLASPVAQEYFRQSAQMLTSYLEATPEIAAIDPHPEYFSSSLAERLDIPVVEVYHHHAHAVSLLAEHRLSKRAVFAVLDGTGYGTDGTIWGGEFLDADAESFHRFGHLSCFPLPGGESAIKEPMRIFVGILAESDENLSDWKDVLREYYGQATLWIEAVKKGINCPYTSSAGRLFDAAAAVAGFRRKVTFEGQAAMWLEGIADPNEQGIYEADFIAEYVPSGSMMIIEMAKDRLRGTAPEIAAAKFHNTVAAVTADILIRRAAEIGIDTVGLTGGCFQNRLLLEKTLKPASGKGLNVLIHGSIPPNDGGLAIGQAVSARERCKQTSQEK